MRSRYRYALLYQHLDCVLRPEALPRNVHAFEVSSKKRFSKDTSANGNRIR